MSDTPSTPPAPLPPPARKVRVMIQHSPTLFSLLGLHIEGECAPTLILGTNTYYRARSTPRWVFYKPAVTGHGESTFHPEQR